VDPSVPDVISIQDEMSGHMDVQTLHTKSEFVQVTYNPTVKAGIKRRERERKR